ncbi:MAG: RHS repeat-associated core domain-containing protein [Acidobacteriota bacterium]
MKSLNRLIAASTAGPTWGLSFSYDGFGNRTSQTVTKGSGPAYSFAYSASTNRITTSGYAYDSNGNLTSMPGLTLSYDVSNRVVSVATANDQDKFATYYRDNSTGLDYAMNRYYGSTLGRFLTPGLFGSSAKVNHPSSWNRYVYVESDPANFYDPQGLLIAIPGDDTPRDGGGGGYWDRDRGGLSPKMLGFLLGGGGAARGGWRWINATSCAR